LSKYLIGKNQMEDIQEDQEEILEFKDEAPAVKNNLFD
jgi:hypothetical protein